MKPWVDFKAIKAAADFRPVLEHYGIELKAKGAELVGLCPFHRDTKPSFRVNLEKQVFHCFGCGAKGNVLDFVSRKEGVTIRASAEFVAGWCNLNEAKSPVLGGTDIAPPVQKTLPRGSTALATGSEGVEAATDTPGAGKTASAGSEAPEEVNRPLTFALKLDPEHPYLAERGLTQATIATFGLGYCSRGVMKGRIAIPIHNGGGELVAYAGRWPGNPPGEEPKYKLPDGFKKSLVLYNLNRVVALKPKPAARLPVPLIVVEGYWSVFRLHQLGHPNVVALMGRDLSAAQESLIAEHAERVIVLLDGDEPGREAAAEIVGRLARRVYIQVLALSEGSEPDTLAEDALRALLELPV